MKGKKLVGLLLITVFVLSIISILGMAKINTNSPGDTPTLRVDDYEFFDVANITCTHFNVTVNILDVTNMKGCDVKLGYNNTLLAAVRVYSTDITKGAGKWLPIDKYGVFHWDDDPTINNTRTYAPDYAYVWISAWGYPPFTGSGPVFTMEFHIIKAPPRGTVTTPQNKSVSCVLDLFETEVLDLYADPIPHDADDGFYSYKRPQIVVTPPVAAFTWMPTIPCANVTVSFDASTSTPNGGTIISYAWDLDGDGVVDKTGVTTTWKYDKIENYTVTLNVTDSEGAWDTVSHVVEVAAKKPTAAFTWMPTIPCANVTVSFDASTSTPNCGSITSYAWDFDGDGVVDKTEIVATTTWEYNTAGTYNITLNVTDSEGAWDTVSHVVEVVAVCPRATLFVHPSVSTVGVSETFKIGIIVNKAVDLYSFEFKLGYNTTILDAIDIWVMWPDFRIINETEGFIWVGASCPYPYPFSGNGTLAAITFTATELGSSVLDLHDTTLVDFYAIPIAHIAVDGYVEVILHDVGVVSVVPSVIEAYPSCAVTVTVTVINEGTQNETFWVALYYNRTATGWTLIGNQTVTDLVVGIEKPVKFVWDTTGVPVYRVNDKYGNYTFKAKADVLPGEVDTADNVLVNGTVALRLLGDVNGDGKIGLADVGKLDLIYSLAILPPYYPPYMPDINCDRKVTLADVGKLDLIYSGVL